VVARGGGVCAAAVVVVVGFERGAGRGGGAVGGGAGVLWRGGLVGCEVHFLFFYVWDGPVVKVVVVLAEVSVLRVVGEVG
jgi:hypothetical protein